MSSRRALAFLSASVVAVSAQVGLAQVTAPLQVNFYPDTASDTLFGDNAYWGNHAGVIANYDLNGVRPAPFPVSAPHVLSGTISKELVQGWLDGTIPNHGVALIPDGDDGWGGNHQIRLGASKLNFTLANGGAVSWTVDGSESGIIFGGTAADALIGDGLPYTRDDLWIGSDDDWRYVIPVNGDYGVTVDSPFVEFPRPVLMHFQPAAAGWTGDTITSDVTFEVPGWWGEEGRRFMVVPVREAWDVATVSYNQLVKPNIWNDPSGGSYQDASNWVQQGTFTPAEPGYVPSGPLNEVATFPYIDGAGDITVTIAEPVTISQLNLDHSGAYTLSGPGAINFDGVTTFALINVAQVADGELQGAHVISTPVNVNLPTYIRVPRGQDTLTFDGPVNGSAPIIKVSSFEEQGWGTINMTLQSAGGLEIQGGVFRINAGTGTTYLGGDLTIGGAKLDIMDNTVVVDYTGDSPAATLVPMLQTSHANGWAGDVDIQSTLADQDAQGIRAIGYGEAELLGWTEVNGTPIKDGDAFIIAYTYYGDANLDGVVDRDDYSLIDYGLAAGASNPNLGWLTGDFNYDGVVDTADYLLIDTSFGILNGLSAAMVADRELRFGADYAAALVVAVPEPTTAGVLVAAAGALAMRRRRA